MIPIEKNVIVVDEQGNEYEATYPKRAKGLVKNGRARFIDTNKICLVCPPDIELEDKTMSENRVNVNAEVPSGIDTSYNISYALEQIEKIHTELKNLNSIVGNIHCISDSNRKITENPDEKEHEAMCDAAEDVALAKVKAIVEIFHHWEESLQKLLAFYEKMYDDLKPHEESAKNKALEMISGVVREMGFYESEQGAQILSDILDTVRHID